MEKRYFRADLGARAVSSDARGGRGPGKIFGYAAVFGQLSNVLYGHFRERIARGAFAESIKGDVFALWGHNTDRPLGRTKAGTLALREDAHGLWVDIDAPDTAAGRDALESIRRGDVDQMSFAFDVLEEDWDQDDDGQVVRTLRKVKLYEVSPVVFPAYPQTSVEAGKASLPDAAGKRDALYGDKPAIPAVIGKTGKLDLPAEGVVIRRRRLELQVMWARMRDENVWGEL